MNTPISNINWKEISKWKLALIAFVTLFVLLVVLSFISTMGVSIGESMDGPESMEFSNSSAPRMNAEMSTDNIATTNDKSGGTTGGDAEDYEALSYNASYKNKNITPVCDTIESWKPLQYVVFEYASRNDSGCQYRFKVEREFAEGILDEVKKLTPEDLSADTTTIKKQVVEYEGKLDILQQQQAMYQNMLEKTENAYNQAVALAVTSENATSLAVLVRDELFHVNKLHTDRINLSQQIQSLAQKSAELQDQIEYVSFSLRATRYEIFDGSAIKDSWVHKMRFVISEANKTLQDVTLGVLQLLLGLLEVVVYVGVVMVVVVVTGRFGWHFVRSVWKKDTVQERQNHDYQ